MKIGIVVHGPNIIDTRWALKLINLLTSYGEVSAKLGGTMGRTAVIDADLENTIDISKKLVPSDSLKLFHDECVDIIFLINYGKSNVTGQVFGYKVYNHYIDKIENNDIPIIQIERPGEVDGSIISWSVESKLTKDLSDKLNLKIVTPDEIYENHIKNNDVEVNQRIIHGANPDENIMVNGVVIGKTTSDKLILIAKDNYIVDIVGGELKKHGLEKLGKVDLKNALVKTGLLRYGKVTPRVISINDSKDFKVSFINHAGEDVYKYKDSNLVIAVGDDTTLVVCDILYRFNIPVIGITDGDLDKVVENAFKVKDSIIFEVESGFDDIVGRQIETSLFGDKNTIDDFSSILDVRDKIIEIIKNINCNYKINYIT